MKYSFDNFGWYSKVEIPNRQTDVVPPQCGDPVVGELYPNFTGYDWIMIPYNAIGNIALVRNNVVENIIVATLEFAETLGYDEVFDVKTTPVGIGWIKVDGVWQAPPVPAPEPVLKSVLTPLEFLNRFTNDEAKTILGLSKTNPDVELWWLKYNKAQDIDLDDPQTIDGVTMLETAGIIAAGRAEEILTKYPV